MVEVSMISYSLFSFHVEVYDNQRGQFTVTLSLLYRKKRDNSYTVYQNAVKQREINDFDTVYLDSFTNISILKWT